MRTIITTNHGAFKGKIGTFLADSESCCHYTFRAGGGHQTRRAWKTRHFRAREPPAWAASPQTWGSGVRLAHRHHDGARGGRGAEVVGGQRQVVPVGVV